MAFSHHQELLRYAKDVVLRGDRNKCPTCGEYFNSTHAFEKHRTGEFGKDRRCRTRDEMFSKGMHLGADGFWRGSKRDEFAVPEKTSD